MLLLVQVDKVDLQVAQVVQVEKGWILRADLVETRKALALAKSYSRKPPISFAHIHGLHALRLLDLFTMTLSL